MSDTVIRVENLSKKYIIRHQQAQQYTALRDVIADGVRSVGRRLSGAKQDPSMGSTQEEFWALKDVSFEVKQGDRIGIIGRNGAGKSTLLKILSRITEPTSGEVMINGRVASLLEVGTGFHPELTGRENIYLNGAILGMGKVEIKQKFDEIVDFAEVAKFIDTPVKHYSSGMYVRLAFGVAAYLESEILIVDEVLAVGDAQFQKKCLGKMENATNNEGRTILFVSHNMNMISSLCSRIILMDSGKVKSIGTPTDAILDYFSAARSSYAFVDLTKEECQVGDDYAILLEGYIKNFQGEISTDFSLEEKITIGMRYKILTSKKFNVVFPYPNCNIFSAEGTHVFYSSASNCKLFQPEPGEYIAEFSIPGHFLNTGTYFVGLAFSCCDQGVKIHFYEKDILSFNVQESIEETLYESRNGFSGILPGIIHPKLDWTIKLDG
jgi:lipopolysaccharide transport system ATP-binding protein